MIDQTKCHGVMCPHRYECQKHKATESTSPAIEGINGQRKIMMATCVKDGKFVGLEKVK